MASNPAQNLLNEDALMAATSYKKPGFNNRNLPSLSMENENPTSMKQKQIDESTNLLNSEGNTTTIEKPEPILPPTPTSTTPTPSTPLPEIKTDDLVIEPPAVLANVPLTDEDGITIYGSMEEFNNNLPETVNLLTTPNGNCVYLVGTAHFSEASQKDVSLVIRNVRPDIVVVELCESRVHILRHDENTLLEEAKDINMVKIRNVIKQQGFFNGLFYILLLNMSAKLTKELGMAPGGEFRTAMKEATKIKDCIVHLGDRPINITLQRAIKGLSLWQTAKLVFRLISFDETISKEDVEQCKQKDLLEQLMKEMAGEFPAFGEVFVNERDTFLCYSLQMAAAHPQFPKFQRTVKSSGEPLKVVGVMGIGHCAGVIKKWGNVDINDIPNIMIIPPASLSTRVFKFTVKYGTLSLIGYGIFKISKPLVQKLF